MLLHSSNLVEWLTLAGTALFAFLMRAQSDGACAQGESGGAQCSQPDAARPPWAAGTVPTKVGEVYQVSSRWSLRDWVGTVMVRLGISRMDYRIAPGLYAVGQPDDASPVFVTANYKKSFDHVRRDLDGYDGWIMVLDTDGINVWCAAGEGSFGSEEMVHRIESTQLAEVVSHRELTVPQLGAPGVAAHRVRRESGFHVQYGPIRSEDLPAYLDAGGEASPGMRRVRFPLLDRLVLTPVEVVGGVKYLAGLLAIMFLLGGIDGGGFSFRAAWESLVPAAGICGLGLMAGAVLTPAFLPWLPGRAFSAKGAFAGMMAGSLASGLFWSGGWPLSGTMASLLLVVAIGSAFGMNFTGASTYTSLSGVRREMRVAVPAQLAMMLIGLILWTAS
jgi:acetyl-CoA decarbonylase/synthase complex subunit gamma